MSAFTQNFQLEYLAVGEPLRNTRGVLQRMTESVDAALTRGGIAPADTQRVVAEIAKNKPAVTLTPGSDWALYSVDRTPLRAWVSGGTGHLVCFLKNPALVGAGDRLVAAAGLPPGYAPSGWKVTAPALINGGQVARLDIGTTGSIVVTLNSDLAAGGWIAIDASWPM